MKFRNKIIKNINCAMKRCSLKTEFATYILKPYERLHSQIPHNTIVLQYLIYWHLSLKSWFIIRLLIKKERVPRHQDLIWLRNNRNFLRFALQILFKLIRIIVQFNLGLLEIINWQIGLLANRLVLQHFFLLGFKYNFWGVEILLTHEVFEIAVSDEVVLVSLVGECTSLRVFMVFKVSNLASCIGFVDATIFFVVGLVKKFWSMNSLSWDSWQ